MLALLTNKYTRYVLVVVIIILLLFGVYWKGKQAGINLMTARYEAEKIEWQNTIAKLQMSFEEQSKEIASNYNSQIEAYKRALATVSKKETIVKYVGANKCEIPKGFVEIHNKAAKGKAIEDTPKADSHQPSGKQLSDTAATVAHNYYLYSECSTRLKGLQAIVKSFQQAQQALTK